MSIQHVWFGLESAAAVLVSSLGELAAFTFSFKQMRIFASTYSQPKIVIPYGALQSLGSKSSQGLGCECVCVFHRKLMETPAG